MDTGIASTFQNILMPVMFLKIFLGIIIFFGVGGG